MNLMEFPSFRQFQYTAYLCEVMFLTDLGKKSFVFFAMYDIIKMVICISAEEKHFCD